MGTNAADNPSDPIFVRARTKQSSIAGVAGEQKPATEDGSQIRDIWPGVEAGNHFALDRSIQPESNKVQYFLMLVIAFQVCVAAMKQ